MSQPKRKEEKPTVKDVLKLVHLLSPEEQEQLVEQVKLEWLKREVQKGIDQAENGEFVDGEALLNELCVRAESRLKKSQM